MTKMHYLCGGFQKTTSLRPVTEAFSSRRRTLNDVLLPWWWNGRHEGLKIPWPFRLCGFESRLGHRKQKASSFLFSAFCIFRALHFPQNRPFLAIFFLQPAFEHPSARFSSYPYCKIPANYNQQNKNHKSRVLENIKNQSFCHYVPLQIASFSLKISIHD